MKKKIIVNNKEYTLSCEYILGLFEGDGSVTIQLKPNPSHKTGKQVILIFEFHQHAIDQDLLTAISIYLGCGKVSISRKVGSPDSWVYKLRISAQSDILNVILPLLQSKGMMLIKRSHDLKLFIKACTLVQNKQHLTNEGQTEIFFLASQLSSKIDIADKEEVLFLRQRLLSSGEKEDLKQNITDEKIRGFVDAEGNFSFFLTSNKENPNYTGVVFNFNIVQEKSEKLFLNNLVDFFGCGHVYTNEKGGGRFAVSNKKELMDYIIPFFEANELQTIKKHSFLRFKKALKICIDNKPLQPIHVKELKSLLLEKIGKRPKP